MKKFRIGKYNYTKNEIAILTIIKWIMDLCKLALGIAIMIFIMLIPFYLVAFIEKYPIFAIVLFIIDFILIKKMTCED